MHQLATNRIVHRPANAAATGPVKPWVWPLPNLGRPPVHPFHPGVAAHG